jgi:hypothetical protein
MTEKKDYQGPLYAPHPDLYEKRRQLGLHNNDTVVKQNESETRSVEDRVSGRETSDSDVQS